MGQSSREFSDSVENNLEYKDACRSKTGAFPDGKQLKDVLPALFVRTLIAFLETGSFSNYEYLAFFFFSILGKEHMHISFLANENLGLFQSRHP